MLSRLNQPITLPRLSLPAWPGAGSSRSARRTTRALVGLDIDPGQIVAAEVEVNGAIRVTRAAGAPVPADVIRDGEVTDVAALSEGLRELFASSGLDRRVRIGLANQRIVVRRLELPPITDPKELATAVQFRAQDEIPMPLDSVTMDFHAVGIVETPDGPRQQVVLVAARRDGVERVLQAARDAGLRPEGVDVSAFAMIRALRPVGAADGERVLYLGIGGLTNLAVAEGRVCQFTRVLGGGVEQIVSELAERVAVPVSGARALLSAVRLDADPPPVGEDGPTTEAGNEQIASAVLSDGVRRIAADVRNSLDFHRNQEGGEPISRAVLCGPAIDFAGFDTAMARELGVPVGTGVVGQTADANIDNVPPSRLTVAAGLAVSDGPA
jgi:type IV pilus assembly protein PilM